MQSGKLLQIPSFWSHWISMWHSGKYLCYTVCLFSNVFRYYFILQYLYCMIYRVSQKRYSNFGLALCVWMLFLHGRKDQDHKEQCILCKMAQKSCCSTTTNLLFIRLCHNYICTPSKKHTMECQSWITFFETHCITVHVQWKLFMFRHTSKLENFNSMLLKYAPKRVSFQWVWGFHVFDVSEMYVSLGYSI
jgi:hypothetical protein